MCTMLAKTKSTALQARDEAILETLTQRVRVLSVPQVARTWWPQSRAPERGAVARLRQLEAFGHVELFSLRAHPEIHLRRPLTAWQVGLPPPDFRRLASALQKRFLRPDVETLCIIATTEAGLAHAGSGGRPPRDSEVTHDIHLAAVYLQMHNELPARARTWIAEAGLPKGRFVNVPDAVVRDGIYSTAIELGGASYDHRRLAEFHQHCAEGGLGYELW